MSEPEVAEEPLWKCLACLELTPRSTWNFFDGLCEECADQPWPRELNQLPKGACE